MFGKKTKKDKSGLVCVSFWINPDILEKYKKLYPRTLSQVVRYYVANAVNDSSIVEKALFRKAHNKINNAINNTIFEEV